MTCDRCHEAESEGMKFCPYCGENLRKRPERSIIEKIALCSTPFVLALLIMEIPYLIGGTVSVWDWAAEHSMNILALLPNLVVITTIHGLALQIAWILIEVSIILSLVYLFWTSYKDIRQEKHEITTVPVVRLAMVFSATIALNLLINGIAIMLGGGIEVPPGMDEGNTPSAILAFADAAVWEEVISRIIPIGIPMTVAALILTKKKESLRYLVGGFGFSRFGMILLVISSAMFGFAHLSGWGPDKVIVTFASGLFIGYLYMRVGLHAAICVHFLTDFLAVITYTNLVLVIGIALIAIVCIGFVSLVWYVIRLKEIPGRIEEAPWWLPPAQENNLFRRKDD